jgi:hypothetical protein
MTLWQKLRRWFRGQCTKHTTEELMLDIDYPLSVWDGPTQVIHGCPDCNPEKVLIWRGWNTINDQKMDAWLAARKAANAESLG